MKKMIKNYETVNLESLAKEIKRCYEELEKIGANEILDYIELLVDTTKQRLVEQGVTETQNLEISKKKYLQLAWTKPTIQLDGAKVKKDFPDWEERYGKPKAGYFSNKGIKEVKENKGN